MLGGTAWVGREVAAQASAAGHEVVCVARGESGAGRRGAAACAPTGIAPTRSTRWRESAGTPPSTSRVSPATYAGPTEALSDVAHFVFVSTANVYADETTPGQDESSALREPLGSDTMASMEEYGAREGRLRAGRAGRVRRALHDRPRGADRWPGGLVGPHQLLAVPVRRTLEPRRWRARPGRP